MLYITTRNKTDSYTAHRALHEGGAPDGGSFLPIRLPVFSQEQINELKDKSFCEIVADILNVFFSKGLSGWDIEFAIGRKPVRLANIGRKITVAQLWRNTDNSYSVCADRIYALLCGNKLPTQKAQGWAAITIRISFLFGVFGQLLQSDILSVDAAASGGDLEAVMALWYSKKMGLPIGKIICGSNENCGVWELINKGQMDTGASVIHTDTVQMDQAVPAGVERLIYGTLGLQETVRFVEIVNNQGVYRIGSEELAKVNHGMFCSVVGQGRVRDIIKSVFATHEYLIDPYTAMSYGVLQDYRAKSGENCMTLLMTEERPSCYSNIIGQSTGLTDDQISKF